MRRRDLLLSSAGLLAATRLRAQTINYRDYSRCLPDYLTVLADAARQRRDQRLATLKLPEYQRWARDTFWQLIGGPLERSPLNIRTTGSFTRTGYRVEKLTYESQPGLVIAANLYVPSNAQPPFPGVLFQMGHSLDGKGNGTYQRCCQGLAQLGFLVLGFDPMGQGERTNYPKANDWLTRLSSADDEHTIPGRQMLLAGDNATRFQLWDTIRSLDVLAAHPLVDPKRLASTGQSGGGTLTMMLATVDDRLAVAAVSSGNTENVAAPGFLPPGSTDDAEQDFLNSGPQGFDRWDTLYPFAPKPLLVIISAKDFFGTYSPQYVRNSRAEFTRLQQFYAQQGRAGNIRAAETPQPHGLAYHPRLEIYNWLRLHLQPGLPPVKEEPPVKPESEETLWAANGSVIRTLNSKTPWILTRERAAKIRTPDTPPDLKHWLALDAVPDRPQTKLVGRAAARGGFVEAWEVQSAPNVWIPFWLYLPAATTRRAPVLCLADAHGRNADWREDALYAELAAAGIIVCAPDLRGIGDLRPAYSAGAAPYVGEHNQEEAYAWSSLIFGKPLVGQRVTDLLALRRALSTLDATQGRPIGLGATRHLNVPALLAAALDPLYTSVYLSGGLVSWRNLIDHEEYRHPMANFMPDALSKTDLPQIARALTPRPLCLAGTVDAVDRPLPLNTVQSLYGTAPQVTYRPTADWTAAALRAHFITRTEPA